MRAASVNAGESANRSNRAYDASAERVIGDVTAVNGQPIRGIWIGESTRPICDANGDALRPCLHERLSIASEYFELRNTSGALIGGLSARQYWFATWRGKVDAGPILAVKGVTGVFAGATGF